MTASSSSSCSLQLVAELKGHSDRVWQATWSPDGKILATCGGDKTVRFWQKDSQTNTYNCIDVLKGSHTRTVRSIDWSPDGNYLACASFDGTTSVWERRKENDEMQEDEEQEGNSSNLYLFVTSLEGHENEVKSVSWDQEGLLLATCGRDKSVWVWENVDGEHFECMSVLQGHTQDVKMVKFHPTQNVLASASYDDTIKIWRGEVDDFLLAESLIGHKSTVWAISFNGDGSKLASVGDDKTLVIWSASEKQAGKEEVWKDVQKITGVHSRTIYSVDWSCTSNLIATGAADDYIRIFGPKVGTQEFELKLSMPKAHATDVNCVKWNPKEEGILVSTSDEPTVKVWKFVQ